jgi:hypothetical protein
MKKNNFNNSIENLNKINESIYKNKIKFTELDYLKKKDNNLSWWEYFDIKSSNKNEFLDYIDDGTKEDIGSISPSEFDLSGLDIFEDLGGYELKNSNIKNSSFEKLLSSNLVNLENTDKITVGSGNDFNSFLLEGDINYNYTTEDNMDSFVGDWEELENKKNRNSHESLKIIQEFGNTKIESDTEFGEDMYEEEDDTSWTG